MPPVFLPFTGGDAALVSLARSRGQVVGWDALNWGQGVKVRYRVHLIGAPAGEVIEVEEGLLELRT